MLSSLLEASNNRPSSGKSGIGLRFGRGQGISRNQSGGINTLGSDIGIDGHWSTDEQPAQRHSKDNVKSRMSLIVIAV